MLYTTDVEAVSYQNVKLLAKDYQLVDTDEESLNEKTVKLVKNDVRQLILMMGKHKISVSNENTEEQANDRSNRLGYSQRAQ